MYRCNKKIKKLLFLIVLIAICIFLKNSKVYAKTVQELQNEYPTGSVWTGGGECAGFATEMYKQYYGISPVIYNEKGYSLDDIRPGTIVRYTGNMGHSVWITGRNGDTVTLGEANYDLANGIRWTTRNISSFSNLEYVYKAPYDIGATPPTIPAPTNIKAEVTNTSGIHVTWDEVQHASNYRIIAYREEDVKNNNFNNPVYAKKNDYATTSHYFDLSLEGNFYIYVHAYVGYNVSPNGGTPSKITIKLIKSININIARTTLVKGETIKAEITYSPSDANNKLTITTSDTSVGEYKPSTGYLSAKKAGTFDLIASASNGVTARKTITVIEGVPATSITLNKYSATIKQGKTFQIIPTVKPDNATNKQCTFKSYNEAIATVSSDGVVTGVGVGKTSIYVSNGNVGISFSVTVEEAEIDPNATLTINKNTYQLNSQNETYQLKAVLSDGNTTAVTWSSSNSNIVSVSSTGLITAKKGGFVHIYAKSSNYGTVSSWVYSALLVTLSNGEKRYVGDMNGDGVFDASDASCILDAYTYNPTPDQKLIGDVSGDGVLDASDASIIQDIFTTEVFKPGPYYHITEIKLNKTQLDLEKGATATLTATLTAPSNTTDSRTVLWSSSDKKIASVDSNGKVTAIGGGMAIITAKTSNGKTATCKVIVDNMPFVDVKSTDWFYNDIKYVYENKLITGYSDKIHFGPNDKITRAMVVTILYRMDGSPAVTGSSKFTDVKQNVWYSNAIKWATDKGIVHGYNSEKFGPNDNITRQDLMVILRNYAKYKKKDTNVTMDLSKYTDKNKIAPYAETAVEWAVKKGILIGSKGKLNPQGSATRAEMAAFIHRYCTKIGR